MVDDISALEQIRVVAGLAKTLVSLGREAKSKGLDETHAERLNNAIIDMQAAVLDAQSDALAAQQVQSSQTSRIAELEQTIATFEDWEAEEARYKLVNAASLGGVFIHMLREESAQGEPLHYICPRCLTHKVKSILQCEKYDAYVDANCPECKTIFNVDFNVARQHGVLR